MASTALTRNGASAKAGKASSRAKAPAKRLPARTSRIPARVAAPARKPAARKARAPAKRAGIPVLPVAVVVAVALLGWFLYPIARLHYVEQRKVVRLQSQLASIQKRNGKLRAEVAKLKTPQGVEEAAHGLGLARPGEQVWVSVQGGKAPSEAPTASPVQAADVATGGWTRVLDAIFGVGP